MPERFVDYYPSVGDEIGYDRPERREHWRDRKPLLFLDRRIFKLDNTDLLGLHHLDEAETSPAQAIQQELLIGIGSAFAIEGCEIVETNALDDLNGRFGRDKKGRFKIDHFLALGTIDLGKFNPAQKAAFDIPVTDEDSFWRFVDTYSQASPQIRPASFVRAKEFSLPGKAPSTYVNVLLREVEDGDTIPDGLSPKQLQAMNWVDSAHYGAWKVMQVFYTMKNGAPELKMVGLGTLEGAHPLFRTNGNGLSDTAAIGLEVGRRLKIFGSVKEVKPEYGIDPAESIDPRVWAELPAVKSLIETGRFLGERGHISGAINISRLVHGKVLPRLLERMAGYSQQAESARCLYEPLLDELIVTVTGTLGGSKTDMSPEDLVAAQADGDYDLLLRRVGDIKPPKPSVEAREFALPLYRLAQEDPDFTFLVSRNSDGSYTTDEAGLYSMWRIVGIDHLHREVRSINPEKIILIQPEDDDAVGCGVDANDEKSAYAVNQAYKQGKQFFAERDYWPTAGVFYVPNHGWNAILFAPEDHAGTVGGDLGKPFRDALENGDIVYGTYAEDVAQV
ncbi:MAG TPA: hypothetical protein VFW90_00305 [Candidatus Saccharimonadales bacterium]|nr:hypothetical protein [Candidatus Saccharimonadales bacterium]